MDNKNHFLKASSLRILYWNARSLLPRQQEIEAVAPTTDIIMITESWLTPKSQFHLPGFITYRKDREGMKGGGLAIFIRKTLAFREIKVKTPDISIELCGIHINNVNPSIDLFLCYRSPGFSLPQDKWDSILHNLKADNTATQKKKNVKTHGPDHIYLMFLRSLIPNPWSI